MYPIPGCPVYLLQLHLSHRTDRYQFSEELTVFGQCVVLLLIQVGGLGVAILGIALTSLIGKELSLQDRLLILVLIGGSPDMQRFTNAMQK